MCIRDSAIPVRAEPVKDPEAYFEGIREAFNAGKYKFALSMASRMGQDTPDKEDVRILIDKVTERIIPIGKRKLGARNAAFVAAKVANDRCEESFGNRPFTWVDFHPVQTKDRWIWGKLDLAGVHGYSTVVKMGVDGTNPDVTVYPSSDGIMPKTFMFEKPRIERK